MDIYVRCFRCFLLVTALILTGYSSAFNIDFLYESSITYEDSQSVLESCLYGGYERFYTPTGNESITCQLLRSFGYESAPAESAYYDVIIKVRDKVSR